MAEGRRNTFESQLKDDGWLTVTASRAVDVVFGLGKNVAALVRHAQRRIIGMMDFADNNTAGHESDDLDGVDAAARHATWNDFVSMADLDARDEQLDRFAQHQVIQTTVQQLGTESEKDKLSTIEADSDRYIYLEGMDKLTPLCSKIEVLTKQRIRSDARQQQAGSQRNDLNVGNTDNDDSGVGSGALITTIPKGLSGALLMDELGTIAQLSDRRLRIEALKQALKDYHDQREDFIQYVREHKTDIARDGEAVAIRNWIDEQKQMRDPVNAAIKALRKATEFEQGRNMPLADYLKQKRRYCTRAKMAGEHAGDVSSLVRTETDWCTLAVQGMLKGIRKEVKRDLASCCSKTPRPDGYGIRGFTDWAVMAKVANQLATQLELDPDSTDEEGDGAGGSGGFRGTGSARSGDSYGGRGGASGRGRGRGRGDQAFAADGGRGGGAGRGRGDGGRGGRGGGMLCSRLPGQRVFKEGDPRVMPPRQEGGPEKQFCVYAWHGERCVHGGPPPSGSCRYIHGVRKETYEAGESAGEEAHAAESQSEVSGGTGSTGRAGSSASMDSAQLKAYDERMHRLELANTEVSAKLDALMERLGVGKGGPEDRAKQARRQARQEAATAEASSKKSSGKSGGKFDWNASSSDDSDEA